MDLSMNWFQVGPLPANVMTGSYDVSLVVLSYIIAVMASYVALDIVGRLRAESSEHTKIYWLLGGAIAMGAGIWSMHFIGMLAFKMPMAAHYNLFWTLLSLLVGILAASLTMYLLKTPGRSLQYLALGGVILGLGIASMHYIGMTGMTNEMQIRYMPGLFFTSIVIAIVASEVALWLILQSNQGNFSRQFRLKIISALVMGAAICGMHYTGMAAAVFTMLPNTESSLTAASNINPSTLAFYIAAVTGIIISIALMVSTSKQLMNSAIQNEKEFLNAVLNNLTDGIMACDKNGNLTVINKSLRTMLNVSKEEPNKLISHIELFKNDQRIEKDDMPLHRALRGESIYGMELTAIVPNGEVRDVLINGQSIINAEGKKLGAVIAIHDISERKKMEQQLIKQATHDLLTGLPNRTLLLDRIEQAINLSKRNNNKMIAVYFIDFDNFKLINDSLSHSAGDDLLINMALRLKETIRSSDTVSRIGGDEFILVTSNLDKEETAGVVASKILKSLAKPFVLSGHEISITASIGISIYPKNGVDADELIKKADTAMYRVKAQGRSNYKFYSEEMNISTMRRLEIEQYLARALDNQEFVLHYQPIIDMHVGRIIGLEALLRWQHPNLGLVPPLDFIPIAEDSGLIIAIGEWVLRSACQQLKDWQKDDLIPIRVAVNVSSRQFSNSDFVNTVRSVLDEIQLEPKYLELELTESVVLENPDEIIQTLKTLKEMGVHISLDDFGTGYSSLGYLRRLPVDKIKIDRSFVNEVTENSDNAAIVLAIIGLASSMKLKITAEGMETKNQLAFLRFNRCDEVQGYYFSKPLPAEECEQLLRSNPSYPMGINDTEKMYD